VNAAAFCRGLQLYLLATTLCFGVTSHATDEANRPPDFLAERSFDGPNRQDFPWHVELSRSWLTFQQRHSVQTRVTFRVRDLLKAGVSLRDLHMLVKLAGEDGRWLPGQSYTHFEPPPGLAAADEIHSLTNLYVRPGTYTVAVMAYDAASRHGNLWRGTLHVAPLKDDPLPGIERNLPQVEFLPPAQPLHIGRGRGLGSMITFDPWALGQGELVLPVANARPVQVDIVANVSLSAITDWHNSEAPNWQYQVNGATLVQISNVLAQLSPQAGCVRLSALDVRRQTVFLDGQDARLLDWPGLRKAISGVNRVKIEAGTLAGEKYEPAFLAHYLEHLSSAPSSCELHGPSPLHILILVSDAFVFPNGTQFTTVQPEHILVDLCYYLRVVPVTVGHWDEIGKVVKPLHPVKLEFSDPGHFRKALAELITDIERASRKPPSLKPGDEESIRDPGLNPYPSMTVNKCQR
jgi:hypothetical protein